MPQLRTAPADERHPDQLLVALAGALVDSDDSHIPGASAGSDRWPDDGNVKCNGSIIVRYLLFSPLDSTFSQNDQIQQPFYELVE